MKPLIKGEKIALIAPSGNPKSQEDIKEIAKIISEAGYFPVYSSNLLTQNNKNKIEDIEKYFSDKSVKAILTLRGGFSCNEILESIDYELIRNNPKIFMGFSDITNLLIAFHRNSELKTIHGPIFSEKKYLDDSFLKNIFSYLKGELNQDDVFSKMDFKIIKNTDKVSGEIIGGNLFVLNNLVGTNFEPDCNNKILFIESVGLSKEIVLSILHHFKQLHIFEKVQGIILGNMGFDEDISQIISEKINHFNGFILKTEKLGHVKDNFPITLGKILDWDGKYLREKNSSFRKRSKSKSPSIFFF